MDGGVGDLIFKRRQIIIVFVLIIVFPMLIVQATKLLVTGEAYFPGQIDDVLYNPYMGWAPSAEGGPYDQPHRLVYINTTWRELEPEKGEYSFDTFEKKYNFAYWNQISIDIIFRMNMDFPSKETHMDLPDWLFEEIGGDGTWYDLDYGKGFSPNYSNETLILNHEKLIKAIAAKYNNNPQVPIIALGSIGHWGEWHTKQDQDNNISIPFPDIQVCNRYVEHYIEYFTNKHLVIRRPLNIAKDNNIGLYNDSFGDVLQTDYFIDGFGMGYFDYLTDTPQEPMPDYWKYAPSGGEIATPPGMACFDKEHIKTTSDQIRKCHTSWLGPSCPVYYAINPQIQKNYDLALKTMGYRFSLEMIKHSRKVKPGGTLLVEMVWKNKGVAPFYYSWPLEISLSDSNGNIVFKTNLTEDIRTWLPGVKRIKKTIPIPKDLNPGKYNVCIAILDPLTGEPAIDIAIDKRRPDGRYSLDEVVVME